MYLGIRKDLIIVTLPYIDRPLADHILISFLIESSRSIKFLPLFVHRNLYLFSFLNLFTLPKSSLRYWVRDSLMYIAESWWMLFPISQATDGSTLAFFSPRCLRDLQNSSRFSLRTNLTINQKSSEVASGRHDTQVQQAQQGTSIHWTCTFLK